MEQIINEAKRQMQICNACRYCEGVCPVFPQMTNYREFTNNNLYYLANLCHDCKACYYGCQYAKPHEFDINIPDILSQLRKRTFMDFTFPSVLSKSFNNNGSIIAVLTALAIALVFILAIYLNSPDTLWRVETEAGAFFKIIPLSLMSGIPLVICVVVLLSVVISAKRFSKEMAVRLNQKPIRIIIKSLQDVLTLKHLDGGSQQAGCYPLNDKRANVFKVFHFLVFYGFMLCFVSTTVASIYHYAFQRIAPYDYLSIPVVLGSIGGIGIIIGTIGILYIKRYSDSTHNKSNSIKSMEYAFIYLLLFVALTGMILLVIRETQWMAFWLCIHLGFVFTLFLMLPYSKFIHMIYRFIAIIKYNENILLKQ